MALYSDKVMDHFRNPRNVGEIPDADGVGQLGNPVCGDIMKIYIKIKKTPSSAKLRAGKKNKRQKEEEIIDDIKFQTFGCGAAVATSSMVTELVKGKTLEEAEKVSNKTVAEALDSLPPVKLHCSNLAADALKKAIEDYKSRRQ